MTLWEAIFRRPARLSEQTVQQWFARIAEHLLNGSRFVIGSVPHRFTEIEFYYRGHSHEDPFAHADPIQVHLGRWYFHRTGGAYRGGSFKGIDLTFGNGQAHAGVLIRGIESESGELIDGPSLVVDRLLDLSANRIVAELDRIIDSRSAWDTTSPLHIVPANPLAKEVLVCARVGLSLRRARAGSSMPAFLTRPYRFLTEPRRIGKGKVQMVMGLHRTGRAADEIRKETGCPTRTVTTYLAEYEIGRREGDFEDYFGIDLGPKDLCRLHGIADR
jgi:hypothetical protein